MEKLAKLNPKEEGLIPTGSELEGLFRLAKELIPTGFLPQAIKTPGQAVAIILTGRELGIAPMRALRSIHVIRGQTCISPELMLSLAYDKIPGFSANVLESTDRVCRIEFHRERVKPYIHTFTIEDAAKLGLAGKDNWIKQPATMLRWRCLSGGMRVYVPDASQKTYGPEEMDPNIRVIEAETTNKTDNPDEYETSDYEVDNSDVPILKNRILDNKPKISKAQSIRLKTICSKGGVNYAKVAQPFMEKTFNVKTSMELDQGDYEKMVSWVEEKALQAKPLSLEELEKTLKSFQDFGIGKEAFEIAICKKVGDIRQEELVNLRQIWLSIKEGKLDAEGAFAVFYEPPIEDSKEEKF